MWARSGISQGQEEHDTDEGPGWLWWGSEPRDGQTDWVKAEEPKFDVLLIPQVQTLQSAPQHKVLHNLVPTDLSSLHFSLLSSDTRLLKLPFSRNCSCQRKRRQATMRTKISGTLVMLEMASIQHSNQSLKDRKKESAQLADTDLGCYWQDGHNCFLNNHGSVQSSSWRTSLTEGANRPSSQTQDVWDMIGPEQVGSKVQERAVLLWDWEAQTDCSLWG